MPDRDEFTPESLLQLEELLRPQLARLFPGQPSGYAVLAFPLGQAGGTTQTKVVVAHNVEHRDMFSVLRETAARFAGQPRQRLRAVRH